MRNVIVYSGDNAVMAIVVPTEEAISILGIDAIAKKDVPFGKRYKIIDRSLIPQSREERNAWIITDEELNDGIGGIA